MAPDTRSPWQPLLRRRAFENRLVSVRVARNFVTDTLTDWGATDRCEDIRLCVSELATNALTHGDDRTSGFLLMMSIHDLVLRVEVHDFGSGLPRILAPDDSSDNGRGLFLVAEYADGWGVEESGLSKAVWVEFKGVPTGRSQTVSR